MAPVYFLQFLEELGNSKLCGDFCHKAPIWQSGGCKYYHGSTSAFPWWRKRAEKYIYYRCRGTTVAAEETQFFFRRHGSAAVLPWYCLQMIWRNGPVFLAWKVRKWWVWEWQVYFTDKYSRLSNKRPDRLFFLGTFSSQEALIWYPPFINFVENSTQDLTVYWIFD